MQQLPKIIISRRYYVCSNVNYVMHLNGFPIIIKLARNGRPGSKAVSQAAIAPSILVYYNIHILPTVDLGAARCSAPFRGAGCNNISILCLLRATTRGRTSQKTKKKYRDDKYYE